MKKLLIIGARGFGREVFYLAQCCITAGADFRVKGFLDDKSDALDGYKNYPPIIDSVENYKIEPDDIFICALGNPEYKKKYAQIILDKKGQFISLVHPSADLGYNATMGIGCIIYRLAFIGQDATIGNFVTMDGNSSIGHDATIGNWSHIGAYAFAAGYARIGESVTLHPGSKVLPHKKIGNQAIVGAGSIVIKSVKEGTTVFGNPAKQIS
jgi:sugar O-acyltransferase (sialic acid O-acetyltransferase NeuD family)